MRVRISLSSRILAERDTVHKEMERLQEDCSSADGRAKELESTNKDLTSEVRLSTEHVQDLNGPRKVGHIH